MPIMTENCHGFHRSLQLYARRVPKIIWCLLPSTSFPIYPTIPSRGMGFLSSALEHTQLFPWGQCSWGMKQTSPLHLVMRLRICGAVLALPHTSAWYGAQLSTRTTLFLPPVYFLFPYNHSAIPLTWILLVPVTLVTDECFSWLAQNRELESGTKQQTEMAMPQVAEMRFLSEHTVQTHAMYQVYMRTLLYLSNIICHSPAMIVTHMWAWYSAATVHMTDKWHCITWLTIGFLCAWAKKNESWVSEICKSNKCAEGSCLLHSLQ